MSAVTRRHGWLWAGLLAATVFIVAVLGLVALHWGGTFLPWR
jgi:hypothetical protein